jgi:hypothetical protein
MSRYKEPSDLRIGGSRHWAACGIGAVTHFEESSPAVRLFNKPMVCLLFDNLAPVVKWRKLKTC